MLVWSESRCTPILGRLSVIWPQSGSHAHVSYSLCWPLFYWPALNGHSRFAYPGNGASALSEAFEIQACGIPNSTLKEKWGGMLMELDMMMTQALEMGGQLCVCTGWSEHGDSRLREPGANPCGFLTALFTSLTLGNYFGPSPLQMEI